MTDLAKDGQISGTVKLYDIDTQAAIDNEIIGNKLSTRKEALSKWTYKATLNLRPFS